MRDYSFTEVMEAKKRMCDSFASPHCDDCPLIECGFISSNICCDDSIMEDLQKAQEIIMQWDKEHPAWDDVPTKIKIGICREFAEKVKSKYEDVYRQGYVMPTYEACAVEIDDVLAEMENK